MPDEKRHTPKAYLVKKPSNHFTQRLTSENMLGDGTLFYFIVFVFFFPFKIHMGAHLFNKDFTFTKILFA